jgi:hypothetical protein
MLTKAGVSEIIGAGTLSLPMSEMAMLRQLRTVTGPGQSLRRFSVTRTSSQTLANLTDNNKYVSPDGNPLSWQETPKLEVLSYSVTVFA